MVRRSVKTRIQDILDAIDGIRDTVADATFEDYCQSWSMRRATERGIEIISEASRHIPAELQQQFPDIPWQDIASIGNKLRHEYARLDDRIIWNVTRKHLDALERAVRRMVAVGTGN